MGEEHERSSSTHTHTELVLADRATDVLAVMTRIEGESVA
jgi:hypothetical protein